MNMNKYFSFIIGRASKASDILLLGNISCVCVDVCVLISDQTLGQILTTFCTQALGHVISFAFVIMQKQFENGGNSKY